MSNEKSLAVRNTAIVPNDVGGFADLAARFAKSALLPADLRGKEADVLVTLIAGCELGFAPMQSLRAIHVVKGKPILAADAMIALVLGRGAAKFFRCVEESDTSVTYETWREGAPEPQRATWTMKDAERAGLAGGDNWKKYPRAMLKARCKAVLARDVYPDVLAGCYEESEREEIEARGGPTRLPTRPVTQHQPPGEPDPRTGEVVDAEFAESAAEHDTWTPFLRSLSEVLKEDTAGWTVADVAREIGAAFDGCGTGEACNDLLRPIVAALDRGNGDPRIAEARAAIKAAYTARKALLRSKAA